MKKIISIITLVVMMTLTFAGVVNASSNATLADDIMAIASKYGLGATDKAKIERYLADYPVTDTEANAVLAKVKEAAKVMDDAGVTNIDELTSEQVDQMKSIANEAASILGVTITFTGRQVNIYKNGKLLEVVTDTNGKLSYTGNNNSAVIIAGVAVVALAAGIVVYRKKFAND